jgi:mannose-6-phosphate isomerase-like protein (cupin superfamily)
VGPLAHKVELEGGERIRFGEVQVVIRASGDSTGGAFSIVEEIPPLVDTPTHVHEREDEMFYVLEGRHVFRVGDEDYEAGPGDLVFGPRGVPHSQRRLEPGVGRLLAMLSPPGFEGFFRELGAAERDGTLGPDAYAAASERYGITWVGDGS